MSTIAMMAMDPKLVKESGIQPFFTGINDPLSSDKVRLNLFKSTTGLHIFP